MSTQSQPDSVAVMVAQYYQKLKSEMVPSELAGELALNFQDSLWEKFLYPENGNPNG